MVVRLQKMEIIFALKSTPFHTKSNRLEIPYGCSLAGKAGLVITLNFADGMVQRV
jgi:hypothetical protein